MLQTIINLKGIVHSILTFFGQTDVVCQSYNGGIWGPPQRACTEKSKLQNTVYFKVYLLVITL